MVTDLGYANVNEVVWEKLDGVNGDTDYAELRTYEAETKIDYVIIHSASAPRNCSNSAPSTGSRLALDEGKAALVEADKKLSLHSYNQVTTDDWSSIKPKTGSRSTDTNIDYSRHNRILSLLM